MSTRSDIIAQTSDGKWKRIYCHSDGYLEGPHGVGFKLFTYYQDQKKIDALMVLGDLSTLGHEIGEKHDFDWYLKLARKGTDYNNNEDFKKYNIMCKAYGRDRGETDCAAEEGDSLKAVWPGEETWTEFAYVWDGEKWYVTSPDDGAQTLVLLEDALQGKAAVNANIKVPFLGIVGKHKQI